MIHAMPVTLLVEYNDRKSVNMLVSTSLQVYKVYKVDKSTKSTKSTSLQVYNNKG